MDHNVCIIDKYFSTLKNVGYLDDDSVTYIAAYVALQELYNSWDWSVEYKKFINTYLNDLESNACIISACTPCPVNNGKSIYYPNNGFPDLGELRGGQHLMMVL